MNAAQKMDQITNKASPTPAVIAPVIPSQLTARQIPITTSTAPRSIDTTAITSRTEHPKLPPLPPPFCFGGHEGIVKPLGADGGQPVAIVGPLAETVTAHGPAVERSTCPLDPLAVSSHVPSATPLVVVGTDVVLVNDVPDAFVTIQPNDVAGGPDNMLVSNDTLAAFPGPTHPETLATGVSIFGHGLHSGTVKVVEPSRLQASGIPELAANFAVTATEYIPGELRLTAPALAPAPLQPEARSVVTVGLLVTRVDLVASPPDCGNVISQSYPVGEG